MSTADLRKQLARLEAQIMHARRALVVFERQRMSVQQRLHQVATFPILTLPTEITVEIFTHCLPTPDEWLGPLPKLRHPPIVFLAVCRAWRDIALATPALWSQLHLRFDTIPVNVINEPGKVEKFGYFFPISRIRDILHFYAPRIACLEINSSQERVRQLDLGAVAFPLLRYAIIEDNEWPADPTNPVPVFTSASQLTEIALLDCGVQSSYVLPGLQLTAFQGRIDDLEFFTLVPNLLQAKCWVDLDCHVPDLPAVITHARLQSLTLLEFPSGDTSIDILDILPYLNLPKLHTLDVAAMKHDMGQSIMGFLNRSQAQLRTLSVTVDNVGHDYYIDWRECLARLDDISLEHLILRPCEVFLRMLLRKNWANRVPLPRLKSLTINESPPLSYEFLLDGLTFRSSHLESFRISFQNGTFLDDEIHKWGFNSTPGHSKAKLCNYLVKLTKAGMSIQIDSKGRKKPVLNLVGVRRNAS
ncbi:hypothetical protein FB45DRAFT_1134761 [Roridomyces roridus]|uniref:F-box domain-containing protein n=1 Tax=Roridomyces roridus TaxID=1738132 RepID=A0AAD7FS17_9AGAR|nr:hypothetical protein FB45DRAFT_1134761 [Roridomyces roridus]